MKRILVALSGGVDSAATVLLLQEMGYDVEAVTFDMLGDKQFMDDAAQAAKTLNIRHHIVDATEQFHNEIINYFIQSYRVGETPAPCTLCNAQIKWKLLELTADNLGIEAIATGHYCKIVTYNGYYYVSRGDDAAKDQSYYLSSLTQSQLSRAVTPMGYHKKDEIKVFMRSRGYDYIADKMESMSVCFLRGHDYRDFLQSHGIECNKGVVYDQNKHCVGTHSGTPLYTIGQKKNLVLDSAGDLRVVAIDAARNALTVGTKEDLFSTRVLVRDYHFTDLAEALCSEKLRLVIRGFGLNPDGFVTFNQLNSSVLEVACSSPAWAVASGQPVVFYIDDRVVGGGVACF